jgi:hypothetical protein
MIILAVRMRESVNPADRLPLILVSMLQGLRLYERNRWQNDQGS